MLQKLTNVINHYRQWRKQNPDTWIEHCKNQKTLSDAIHFAAMSENHLNKRHPHQYRLKKADLELFTINLLNNQKELSNAYDFDNLLKTVNKASLKGVGQLTIYDTTQRLGEYLNILPDKIYLHAGTRLGAKKLIGEIKGKSIMKNDLPEPFKNADLTCSQLEDILCIYKHRF